jgi:hypothetical protein
MILNEVRDSGPFVRVPMRVKAGPVMAFAIVAGIIILQPEKLALVLAIWCTGVLTER